MRPLHSSFLRRSCAGFACALSLGVVPAAAEPQPTLPPAVAAALERAGIPASALAAVVAPVDGAGPMRLAWRADAPMNAASLMKLTTTFAALDLLGPAYTW